MAEPEKMTREEIKEFVFDVFVEIVEATGATAALPPTELAGLAEEPESRVKGCMMQLQQEGILQSFKEDGELFFQLSDDTLDVLLEEMKAEGWTLPEDPFASETTDEPDDADDD